jgi:hypothetical protein
MKIRFYSLFIGLAMPVMGLAQQQAVLYKQAAQSFFNAAAQDPANASCDKAWGDYYNCLADQLVSGVGANVTCTQPTCTPGTGQGAAPSTYKVNGQSVSQSQFNNTVQKGLVPVPVPDTPLANPDAVNPSPNNTGLPSQVFNGLTPGQQDAATAANSGLNALKSILQKQQLDAQQVWDKLQQDKTDKLQAGNDLLPLLERGVQMQADPKYETFNRDYTYATGDVSGSTVMKSIVKTIQAGDPVYIEGIDMLKEDGTACVKLLDAYDKWKQLAATTSFPRDGSMNQIPIANANACANLGSDQVVAQIQNELNSYGGQQFEFQGLGSTYNTTYRINSIDGSHINVTKTAISMATKTDDDTGAKSKYEMARSTSNFNLAWNSIIPGSVKLFEDHVFDNLFKRYVIYHVTMDTTADGVSLASQSSDEISGAESAQYTTNSFEIVSGNYQAAQQMAALFTRAAQLAGGNASGTGISASPTTLQAQPALATPQQLQSSVSGPVSISPATEKSVNALLAWRKQLVNLTDDQVIKIKPFLEIYVQNIHDVSFDRTLSQDDKVAKRGAISTDYYKNLKDILTPDQYTQWMAYNNSHATPPTASSQTQLTLTPAAPQPDNSQTQSTAQNPPEIFLNQIAPQLNLTDDQKLQFKAILDKYYDIVLKGGSQRISKKDLKNEFIEIEQVLTSKQFGMYMNARPNYPY